MFDAVTKRLEEIATTLDQQVPDVALVQSFIDLQAEFLQRVFVDGVNSKGKKFGTYSEEPSYYTKDQFIQKARFKAQGKDSSEDSKTGVNRQKTQVFNIVTRKKTSIAVKSTKGGGMTERKSMYLPKGYKEFRDIQGRPTGHVNLNFSGSLEGAFRVFKFGDSVLFGQNDEFEHKKIEGLEKKYGEFQQLTKQEIDNLKARIGNEVALILRK